MELGYTSILTKETLAYNLVYHIKKANTEEELYEQVKSILNSFELKKENKE